MAENHIIYFINTPIISIILKKIVFFAELNLYLPDTNTNKKALEERK